MRIAAKKIVNCISAICLICIGNSGFTIAQTVFWNNGKQQNNDSKIKSYYSFELNTEQLREFLSGAIEIKLSLPDPTGREQNFTLTENDLLAPELKNKFPRIKTFSGYMINDPLITIKAEMTVHGFHAMIFNGDSTYTITPDKEAANYKAYFRKDYNNARSRTCYVNSDQKLIPDDFIEINPQPAAPQLQHGSQRKRYRLALSCTGEYAIAVDGAAPTVAGVLSAMATTMNRVNGIYEREMAVTMQLVANNDTLIFLSGSSDPFNNNNADAMLIQNQTVVNNRIGAANYDIGHVFSTGGGGLAMINSVCVNFMKAQGVTGNEEPYDDPFDVDYVAHEMGHQFGAEHTQNRCSNEEASSAFEPGSGSTIMGYAGLCGANNLQRNSHDYFHANSIREILAHLNDFPGCGTNLTGHTPPASFSINSNYTIPARTAFELIAPTQNEILYYNWFQWNLGNFRENESQGAGFTAGPSLRSYRPDTTGVRVFPRLDSLLANRYYFIGERISTVDRKLNFRLLVRKMENNWGAFFFTEDSVKVDVINTGEPFAVTFPNSVSDFLISDTINQISWNIAGTNSNPIHCDKVDIFLSTDGGYTYPVTLATEVDNSGSALVQIPEIEPTNTARVKVKGHGNIFFDISNVNIRIVNKDGIPSFDGILIYPNPAQYFINIKHGYNIAGSDMTYSLYDNTGRIILHKKITQNTTTINIAHLSKGIYILKVNNRSSNDEVIQKITLR